MSDQGILFESISSANQAQIDGLWAILKCREMGILRKVFAMCEVLNLDSEIVLPTLPQDEDGRIFDSRNRFLLSQALISACKLEDDLNNI